MAHRRRYALASVVALALLVSASPTPDKDVRSLSTLRSGYVRPRGMTEITSSQHDPAEGVAAPAAKFNRYFPSASVRQLESERTVSIIKDAEHIRLFYRPD
jgi:hypothetical protein